jgi:hypothetical protein
MDKFTTVELLDAIEEKGIKKDNFFYRMFFREEYTFTTEKVDLDLIPSKTKIAGFCSPMIGGQVDRANGYNVTSFKPAYVKSKHAVNPNMTLKRTAGEKAGSLKSPSERQAALVMQNIRTEEEAISMREELMAAEMVIKGEYLIDGPNVEESFVISANRKPGNNITLIGAARLSQLDPATFKLVKQIEDWANEADGLVNIMVLDKKAWSLVNLFEDFSKKLETRRGSKSELETSLKDLGKTVSHKGTFGDVEIYVVDEEYTARDGSTQKVIPDNTMILGHFGVRGLRLYGAIQDLNAQNEGLDEATRYVRDWTEGNDPAVRYTKTESAPAPYLVDVNSFVVISLDSIVE